MPTFIDAAAHIERTVSPDAVHTRGARYDAAVGIWNGAVTNRPAVVVTPRDDEEVAATVRAVRELGLPVSVRGGGHGWGGASLTDGGVTIDLSSLRGVTVDAERRVADVQGGALGSDLARAAGKVGLLAALGTAGSVGVVGLTLGGGYGPISGVAGLAVDSVLEIDIVLADGSPLTVSAESEPDLFWALRGGGGNFGVVTGMRLRLHSAPALLAGMAMYPLDGADDVMVKARRWLLDGLDELTLQMGVMTGPTGDPVFFLAPTWCGDPREGEAALAAVTAIGSPVFAQAGPVQQTDQLAQMDAMFPAGRHVALKPRTLPAMTPDLAEVVVAAGRASASPFSAISLHSLHGVAARVPCDATAYGNRSPHLMAEVIGIWEPGETDDRAWVVDTAAALDEHALPGTYANLLGPDEAGLADTAYGANAQRLLAAKAHYDPDGMFSAIPLPRG